MTARLSAVLTAVLIAVTTTVSIAQTPADSSHLDSLAQKSRHVRCWRARPMPECRMVFLTDIGLDMPIWTTATTAPNPIYSKAFPVRLNWSIGLMRNGDRHSHGVSLSITSESSSQLPQIIEYRYRNWLGRGSAIDAAVGWKRNEVWEASGLDQSSGMTFMLGYTPTRWLGASVRYDFVKGDRRTHRAVMLGLQSTRVSEYVFKGMALAIVDGLLAKIGLERDSGEDSGSATP